MNVLAWIGETRIAQAVQDRKLDNLPGVGQPLDLTPRDAALDAQARLGLELLDRAQGAGADCAKPARTRGAAPALGQGAVAPARQSLST